MSKKSELKEYLDKKRAAGHSYLGYQVYDVSNADLIALENVSRSLGVPFTWLSNLINHETAGTFNPAIRNNLGYTGLLQFGSSAADSLDTTSQKLKGMSFQSQLVYVEKYLRKVLKSKGLIGKDDKAKPNLKKEDFFMSVFYPKAVGNPDYVFPPNVQKANGLSTPREYVAAVAKSAPFDINDASTDSIVLPSLGGVVQSLKQSTEKLPVIEIAMIIFGLTAISYVVYRVVKSKS